jgi:hypothetical protein
LFFLYTISNQDVLANDYLTYQEIIFENNGAMLLEDFSTSKMDKYYEKMRGFRFWGWTTYVAYENESVVFLKETLFVIVNEGDTAIVQSMSFKSDEDIKKQYSVTGNLGLNGSGTKAGFKLGLEQQIKYAITATSTSSLEKDFEIKVNVDPYTKLIVEIRGEGKVTNGVAKYYRLYKCVRKGGWEVFVVTTEYYNIIKERIDEA